VFDAGREPAKRCLGGRGATIRCTAEIDGATGYATRVEVDAAAPADSCIRAVIEAMTFPTFEGGPATVSHTYRFRSTTTPPPARDAGTQRIMTGIDDIYPLPGENPF